MAGAGAWAGAEEAGAGFASPRKAEQNKRWFCRLDTVRAAERSASAGTCRAQAASQVAERVRKGERERERGREGGRVRDSAR